MRVLRLLSSLSVYILYRAALCYIFDAVWRSVYAFFSFVRSFDLCVREKSASCHIELVSLADQK